VGSLALPEIPGIIKNGFRIRIKSQNNGGVKGDTIVLIILIASSVSSIDLKRFFHSHQA